MQAALLPTAGQSSALVHRQPVSYPVGSRRRPASTPKRHRSSKTSRLSAQDQTGQGAAASGEKFIYPGDVLEEARRMSNDFVFEDSEDQPVWEHDERLASTSSSSVAGSEVKGALDPEQMTDVLTAYSAEQGFREVGIEALRDQLGQRATSGLILLDVRSKEEFEGGHVPSALNVPLDKLSTCAKDGWLGDCKTRPIAVVCKSGSRSAQAAVKLTKVLGFEDVVNVSGGTEGWMTAGGSKMELLHVKSAPEVGLEEIAGRLSGPEVFERHVDS
ncbi:hypothetical protein WJX74_004196 [Apatococcus lobatus]|uniref:Rhodanese domain-containing protein n=1 Tax=Apatococcus lobatus TaxID=904363 RepID=A0AAW1REL4_9CHLO